MMSDNSWRKGLGHALAISILVLGGISAASAQTVWNVTDESAITFTAMQQGAAVEGGFAAFDADIILDPGAPDDGKFKVTIDTTSIESGHDNRDTTLQSPAFFDVEQWPTALFESSKITDLGDGNYEAEGQLTIRDVTKDVILPFVLDVEEGAGEMTAMAEGELAINRLDYGVGQGEWESTATVADEVIISIDIKASTPAS